jgi:Spy/CpxP family protein refolding chaperone
MCHKHWARRRAEFASRHSHHPDSREGAREGFGPFAGAADWEGDPMHRDRGENFGIRRPLRFLAHKLELDDAQIAELARILDELKIERAQVDVDDRRTLSEFADAVGGETFDAAKAASAGERRVTSAARLRDTLIRSLTQIHAMLRPDQRARMAYLIRTGVLAL